MSAAGRAILLYDADCGFCTRAIGFAARLRLDVEVQSLQSADLAALGVDSARAQREIPLVEPSGQVRYGVPAIAAALRTGNRAVRVLGDVMADRPVGAVLNPVYRWVAAHRQSLPGGTPACVLPD